ncbi:ACP S-malonyltransferase [Streptomyces sp. BE147]|uniref:ACP S-malonyltransferase n=1 Tax=Streptomyces sp. BE147 TaxID=3002524 RepID=UPI002E7708AD|nr:ACP S-malonyltransferase [Streptomyces sp. BE147]MEE1737869.1 ACP S-malonyltransferase [Streptomyces sp. BE147]
MTRQREQDPSVPLELFAERVAVAFPGQGSQGRGMGALWREHPAWDVVERAEAQLGRRLAPMLLDPSAAPQGPVETQLAVVLCSLMAWSALEPVLGPVVLAGHSLGLVPALQAAGVLSLEGAISVASLRAEETARACADRPGGMAVVLMPAEDAKAACAGAECWVANDNAPRQSVIAGTTVGLGAGMAAAHSHGADDVIRLEIAGAFHTPLMTEAAERLAALLKDVPFTRARRVIVHNGTGHMPDDETDWRAAAAADIVMPVRWRQTQLLVGRAGLETFVEAGYGRTLTGIAKRTLGRRRLKLCNVGGPQAVATITEAIHPADRVELG